MLSGKLAEVSVPCKRFVLFVLPAMHLVVLPPETSEALNGEQSIVRHFTGLINAACDHLRCLQAATLHTSGFERASDAPVLLADSVRRVIAGNQYVQKTILKRNASQKP